MFEHKTKGGETVRLDEATVEWLNAENARLHFVDKSAAIRYALTLARKPVVDGIAQSEYDRVNTELKTALTEIQRLQTVNTDVNTELQTAHDEIQRLQTVNNDVNQQLQTVNAELQAVNTAHETVNIQRLQGVDDVNTQIQTIQDENEALREMCDRSLQFTEKQMKLVNYVYDKARAVNPAVVNTADVVFGVFLNYCHNPQGRFRTDIASPIKP